MELRVTKSHLGKLLGQYVYESKHPGYKKVQGQSEVAVYFNYMWLQDLLCN